LALILGQGLVTSQGELWHKQRSLMQPVFNRSRIMTMLPQMNLAGLGLLERWDQMAEGSEINIAQEMTQLMLEVITQTLFSTSVLDEIDEIAPALDIGLRYAAKTAVNPLTLPLSIPTRENRLFLQSRNKLNQVIKQIIQQRRNTDSAHHDLLDMLLTAKDPETGAMMNDQQIRDEVITYLL
jgi:cytochrome P450